jgi:hypothetical protein
LEKGRAKLIEHLFLSGFSQRACPMISVKDRNFLFRGILSYGPVAKNHQFLDKELGLMLAFLMKDDISFVVQAHIS